MNLLLLIGLALMVSLWLMRAMQLLGTFWRRVGRTTIIVYLILVLLWPSLLSVMVSPPFLIALSVLTVAIGMSLGGRINAVLRRWF